MTDSVGVSNDNGNSLSEKKWNDRLAYALRHSNVKRANLHTLVGVSAPTVHDWLHGNIKMIAGDHLIRVCEILRINPAWLITGQGLMIVAERRQAERRIADRRASGAT